uniref:Cytochrome c oxidase subunit 2 n=1 Tax=Dicyema sp. TaxID=48272 RepID=A0A3G1SBZ9_9BILA|nr:cytochrome c oxidase subunit 2 [Dicyema sp.]
MVYVLASGFVDMMVSSSDVLFVHDVALCVLMMAIIPVVLWVMFDLASWRLSKVNVLLHDESLSSKIEVIWTVVPICMLMILAWNSVSSLYTADNLLCEYVVKVIGNQWYWSWEYYSMFSNDVVESNSYMVAVDDLVKGGYFTMDVDNRICIPCMKSVEFLISSNDVLHSFALPNIGVKVDAVPGRIVSLFVSVDVPSILYGQCSEMCGTGHALMPIVVEVIPEMV